MPSAEGAGMAKGKPGRGGGDGPAGGASKTGNPSGKNPHKR